MHEGGADEAQNGKADYLFRCCGIHEEEEVFRHGKTEGGGYHVHHPVHGLIKMTAVAYEHENDEEFNKLFNKCVDADRGDGIFRYLQKRRRERK